jgi:dolichyl-phosphate-mannose--protein O-mannosyl transferase
MMGLWMSGRIVEYWYHYLTPWGLAVPLLAGVVARLDRRYPMLVFAFVALAFLAAVFFAPIWAEFPISQGAANARLLWR